jgi:PhnB protein
MAFHPYVFFSDGTCREAFTRYQEIFGGQLDIMTMADAPPDAAMPGAPADAVMHASLTIGDALLMGSDDPTGDGGPKIGAAVSYSAPDDAEAKRIFDALAEGGSVTMPFSPTFFSRGFGMCTDRFGVPWMVDAGYPDDAGA